MERSFLITGAAGQLGRELVSRLEGRSRSLAALSREDLDISCSEQIESVLDRERPEVVFNCAAYTNVEQAEREPGRAYEVNADGAARLARACRAREIMLVHFSTDYVFDGALRRAYVETDRPNPINVYGKSKLRGEEAIRGETSHYLIFRSSWLFGMGERNFLYKLRKWMAEKDVLEVVDNEVSVPCYVRDVARFAILAVARGLEGTYHLTNSGYGSRFELAAHFLNAWRGDVADRLVPVDSSRFSSPVQRPPWSVLSSERLSGELGIAFPSWRDAVSRFVNALPGRSAGVIERDRA